MNLQRVSVSQAQVLTSAAAANTRECQLFATALLNEIIPRSEVPKAVQPPAGVEQCYVQDGITY